MTITLLIGLVILLLAPGCATPPRQSAVPEKLQNQAQIPGLEKVRYRLGNPDDIAEMEREGIESIKREEAYLAASGHHGPLPPAVFLAISGGGDNGAFGAGLLNGWTAAGNRPTFKLVTGVSTGALTAPFAFAGPTYDATLKEVYTTISAKDIAEPRSLLAALTSDAMADNHPLGKLLAKYVNQALLDVIAAEYAKGRLLLVGTTDLDARRGIIWNLTKIAASRDPKALDMFRTLMIASAAIPGAFPPTMIDVAVNGQPYQEMHVDGGATAQVFVYPPSLHLKDETRQLGLKPRERRAYVIRNSRLDPEWSQVERSTMTIAGRAISSLIHTQGIGDLYRIYLTTQRDGVDFNLAYIPDSFNAPHQEDFDTEFMRQLFAVGYDLAAKGYPWQKTPPGFASLAGADQ
ncbi:patatin-like phospholipase family protein [Candidatus Contendibacter odensensis]|nr:patatin-like phospholipase family protein [Candidatus Contendobacter odensis]MBK8751006.1 patatin-like phospholipase family protein [Candidatus Competibacteraceae bacterium]